ncbi:TetR family transcriptional regulator [Yersinia enterocolitica]|uniref:TetR family transcriptional regulator n=1 Tax=Yersinia enterocolitica TaxID=630 RepID=A0A0H5EUK7_YEREN|nr:TetR family transcriptional regulator [Yersinia enterocolitica]CNB94830.1 TetR family transcriptional regulator [Yersinia enterocolitica]CNC50630.1 TetR family transcriptional regulator [Yersinia enterocolitica]CNC50899.1 TetR family transcriptional regulator [Yersinia enterocolitica]CNC80619.1 TetR family transcriptional regulator [Yersinia enterocolitica]
MKLATSDTPALEIKPSRRSKAGAAKRQLIMTAALELFSLYGFHGTSLDQVAERADVSKTNLLYYFPSKEALYIAVLKDILAIWLAPLKALQADQQPVDAIRHYIALKLTTHKHHACFVWRWSKVRHCLSKSWQGS